VMRSSCSWFLAAMKFPVSAVCMSCLMSSGFAVAVVW